MQILMIDRKTKSNITYYTNATISFGLKYFNFINAENGEYLTLKIKDIVSITIN